MNVRASAEVSKREAEVLEALGRRLSNAQIANRLHLSVRTVEGHVSSLLRKYRVSDRQSLAALATRAPAHRPGICGIAGLPVSLTTFVGRQTERGLLLDALAHSRMVTLVGPGGVGKTRLAALVAGTADGFPFGGAFVNLVPVQGELVPQAVAATLQVTEQSQVPLEETIADHLNGGRSLVVLDNCEHVLDAVARFATRMLLLCPDVTVLATSRERLGVPGERSVVVGPLPLHSDAEHLFIDRAAAASPSFAAGPHMVTELCARLDGLPLAIELAAARVPALGPDGILAAMSNMMRLLAGSRSADRRHRSLHSLIGWSYNLLDDDERALFRATAMFVDQFDLDAAFRVSSISDVGVVADLLGRLVAKGLVEHQPLAPSRWRLLDTVRAFAAQRLHASGERADVRRRYLAWAETTVARLLRRLDEPWQPTFDAQVGDLRAASAATGGEPDALAHRLTRGLAKLTYARGFLMESLDHYRQAAARAPTPREAAADLQDAAGCARVSATSGLQVFELLLASAEQAGLAGRGNEQAIALARAVETANRHPALFASPVPQTYLHQLLDAARAAADPEHPAACAWLAVAAAWTAVPAQNDPDPVLARLALEAAYVTGDPVLISASLDAVGTAAEQRDEPDVTTRQRFALLTRMDHRDPQSAPEILDTYSVASAHAVVTGDLPRALGVARAMLEDELLGGHVLLSAGSLIPPLVLTGDFDEAFRYADIAWHGWQAAGRPAAGWLTPAISAVALAHGLAGDREAYRTWRARIDEIAGLLDGEQLIVAPLAFADARVAVHTGDLSSAPSLVAQAAAEFRGARYRGYARTAAAELAVIAGLPAATQLLEAAIDAAARSEWAAACVARIRGRQNQDAHALVDSARRWGRIGARFERACTMMLLPERAHEALAEFSAMGVPPPAVVSSAAAPDQGTTV
ncbi:LuxR C-terminal-related transcriptional regulator [Dactylosporangium sp. NPDC049525]|uniref:ATP-binding protein n=1 Tax=Dactylosporangium sp. NPDC049525 TaxID=3154730 RepID=UPI00341F3F7B